MEFAIYGAYGYTGELIAALATQQGYRPLLAGRNEAKLKKVADRFQLPYQTLDLADTAGLDLLLAKVRAVLHIAGPYSATARQMVAACLKNKVHYIDVTGEWQIFEWVATQDLQAKKAGITLLPGAGFDVVPSDCLANYLKDKLPTATQLELVIKGVEETSRGTMLTMLENAHKGAMIREKGQMKKVALGYKTRQIAIAGKQESAVNVPWGDLVTAYHSTGIPDITTYFTMSPKIALLVNSNRYFGWMLGFSPLQALMKSIVRNTIKGPDLEHRQTANAVIWGEVSDDKGHKAVACLETPEAYKLTAHTALASALRILQGGVATGFQTPASAFGAEFILDFEGVELIDLQ
jgi:short subunit dehydrogenase-like uncharacterized protein